jgi:hypothetical protein
LPLSTSFNKSTSLEFVVAEAAASVTSCIANQVGSKDPQTKKISRHPPTPTPKCAFTTNNTQLDHRILGLVAANHRTAASCHDLRCPLKRPGPPPPKRSYTASYR